MELAEQLKIENIMTNVNTRRNKVEPKPPCPRRQARQTTTTNPDTGQPTAHPITIQPVKVKPKVRVKVSLFNFTVIVN